MMWTVAIVSFVVGRSAGIWATLEHNDDHVTKLSMRLAFVESLCRNMSNQIMDIESNANTDTDRD